MKFQVTLAIIIGGFIVYKLNKVSNIVENTVGEPIKKFSEGLAFDEEKDLPPKVELTTEAETRQEMFIRLGYAEMQNGVFVITPAGDEYIEEMGQQ